MRHFCKFKRKSKTGGTDHGEYRSALVCNGSAAVVVRKKARGVSDIAVSFSSADSAAFDPNKDKPRFREGPAIYVVTPGLRGSKIEYVA